MQDMECTGGIAKRIAQLLTDKEYQTELKKIDSSLVVFSRTAID
jgi:hypothetical protein